MFGCGSYLKQSLKGKSMKKFFLLSVLFSLIATPVKSQNIEDIRLKIDERNKYYTKAILENDVEAMLGMYTDNILSLPSYQPMIRGMASVRAISEEQKETGWRTTHFVLNTTDIIPAGNYIIEVGNYDMIMSPPDSEEEWPDNGKYITVWEVQDDGSLKIRVETWNTDINPWVNMNEEPMLEEESPD